MTGSLSGNGNFTSNPQSGSSLCPAGDVMQGITFYTYIVQTSAGGAQAVCADARGNVTAGDVIGSTGDPNGQPATESMCPAKTVGVGLYGRAGDVVDGFGMRCGTPRTFRGSRGVTTDATYVGDSGGNPQGPFDCPAGSELTGLEGTSATYFGGTDLVTLAGVCSPTRGRNGA